MLTALLLEEAITISFVIGAALMVAGVWVGAVHEAPETADVACGEMPSKAVC